MEDQRKELAAHGITAICITHETSRTELSDLHKTGASVIFTSPEALRLDYWRNLLLDREFQKRLCLIACDEAHCISEWGENFRPEYREISQLRSLTETPMAALTATSTDRVQADIFTYMLLDENLTLRVGRVPNRPNIFMDIRQTCTADVEVELKWLVESMKSSAIMKKTIIFCRSYSATYSVWSWLVEQLGDCAYDGGEKLARKRKVEMFHASTDPATKEWIMDDFKSQTSIIRVLVCTVAFGMGIHIPDIREVVHWGAPKSILSYFQEIGRGGRDVFPSRATMYPFKRSLIKTMTSEDITEVVKSEVCVRRAVLLKLITSFMKKDDIPVATKCNMNNCITCRCEMCQCCSVCMNLCPCFNKS